MSAKTKIIVLRMKELVYTGLFILLGILLILLLVIMFSPKKEESENAEENALYRPGIYTTSIQLGDQAADLEVIVDRSAISSIQLVNLNESVSAMYPLMEPALENIASQICAAQSTENITYPEESRYTSQMILAAVEQTLAKARTESSEKTTP